MTATVVEKYSQNCAEIWRAHDLTSLPFLLLLHNILNSRYYFLNRHFNYLFFFPLIKKAKKVA